MLFLCLLLSILALLIGYFEFSTSLNPYYGFRKGLRGLTVIIGIFTIFGDFENIRVMALNSIISIEEYINNQNNREDYIKVFLEVQKWIDFSFFLGLFIIGSISFVVFIWGLGYLIILSPNDPERRKVVRILWRSIIGISAIIIPLAVQVNIIVNYKSLLEV